MCRSLLVKAGSSLRLLRCGILFFSSSLLLMSCQVHVSIYNGLSCPFHHATCTVMTKVFFTFPQNGKISFVQYFVAYFIQKNIGQTIFFQFGELKKIPLKFQNFGLILEFGEQTFVVLSMSNRIVFAGLQRPTFQSVPKRRDLTYLACHIKFNFNISKDLLREGTWLSLKWHGQMCPFRSFISTIMIIKCLTWCTSKSFKITNSVVMNTTLAESTYKKWITCRKNAHCMTMTKILKDALLCHDLNMTKKKRMEKKKKRKKRKVTALS